MTERSRDSRETVATAALMPLGTQYPNHWVSKQQTPFTLRSEKPQQEPVSSSQGCLEMKALAPAQVQETSGRPLHGAPQHSSLLGPRAPTWYRAQQGGQLQWLSSSSCFPQHHPASPAHLQMPQEWPIKVSSMETYPEGSHSQGWVGAGATEEPQ